MKWESERVPILYCDESKSELARDVDEYRDNGQNAQHFVPYSTRFLVEHKTSVMWNNG